MKARLAFLSVLGGIVVASASVFVLRTVLAEDAPAEPPEQAKPAVATSESLGGEDRFVTQLSTDKPIYKEKETLYVRGVLLHHASHAPLPADKQANAVIHITGPKGDEVASGRAASEDSVLGFKWDIPKDQPGGEYTINVTFPQQGYPPAERKFDVRAYRAPRMKTQIKFVRDGYGPGDEVAASLNAIRAEGGAPAGAKVSIIARVDGVTVYEGATSIDAEGNCSTRFPLPDDIRRGEGSLTMVVEDGGVVETAVKTIPILLQTVDLNMYPEGGELAAGAPNRVYFEAFTPAGKPADLAGVVVDAEGAEVAKFRSAHEGRGRFEFTPAADKEYSLKITEPSGINTSYPLPAAKADGVAIASLANVTPAGKPVALRVAAGADGQYKIVLRKREQTLAEAQVQLKVGQPLKIELDAKQHDGVLTATVFDTAGKPRAERLVFRQPAKAVSIKITADAEQYTPGGKAKLTVETSDAQGNPTSAVVGVAVTDDSVLEMIDKREQAPRLPVMVFLENEVKDLADAHVYLDPNNEDAPQAVDMLLGVQGWRRFVVFDTNKAIAEHGDDARRALAMKYVQVIQWDKAKFFDEKGGEVFEARRLLRQLNENRNAVQLELADGAEAAPDPQAEAVPVDAPHAAAPPPAAQPAAAAPAPKPAPQADLAADRPLAPPRLQAGGVPDAKRDFDRLRQQVDHLRQLEAGQVEREEALGRAALEKQRRALPFGKRQAIVRDDFVAVRIYAHELRPNRQPNERTDFTETLFWHAGLKTDDTGKATFEFALNDSVTSFRVAADAFNGEGAIGAGTLKIESVEPFYLEPKLPLEVTEGDVIQAPVGVVNATTTPLGGAQFEVTAHEALTVGQLPSADLAAGERARRMLSIDVGSHRGDAEVKLSATAGAYSDSVTRKIAVVPKGFPVEQGYGGLISPGETATEEVVIPELLVSGSVVDRIVVYPTPLANMQESMARLIREPSGCFEQTSSSVYPLVMAQQYFMTHQGVDPALIERSADVLNRGYDRLAGYECPSGGFEWWGADPAHDALTAYGLMEFTDMAQVRHVDPALLERTRNWLLAQRDGKGGYKRLARTLHTWVTEPECQFSYNTWALLSAGVDADLSAEVAWATDAAEKTENTYAAALGANVAQLGGDKDAAARLLDKLAGLQEKDGSVRGATQSVVGSGGEALKIEATALAALAWMRDPHYAAHAEKAIQYLAESCKGGRYGSTQSTILALKAIVEYDKLRAHPKAPGSFQLIVDGKPVGEAVAFDAESKGPIELPGVAQHMTVGAHKVQIKMTGGSPMPYSVTVEYNTLKPNSAEECKVHLHATLADERVTEGESTEVRVALVNRTNEAVPTPMGIVGLPGGLEPDHDQLKELVKEKKIAAYEIRGREVLLYWRGLEAEQRVEFPIRVVAAIPGKYQGPASRAYLYYTDEHKHWLDPLAVVIDPRQ